MPNLPDFGDNVDIEAFTQVLNLDDSEDDRGFSRELVMDFFAQVKETFDEMDKSLADKDLKKLSAFGHFLRGHSASLGFKKIRDSCLAIEQYGHKQNVDGSPEPNEEICLANIKEALENAKVDNDELEKLVRPFFENK